MKKSRFFIGLLALLSVCGWSCSPRITQATTPAFLSDGHYDNYPIGDVSNSLDRISQSIYKVNVIAFYKTYYFTKEHSPLQGHLDDSLAFAKSSYQSVTHETAFGTATLVYFDGSLAGFLTCAHVVHFKDTVPIFFPDEPKKVYSLSVKIKQNIYVSGMQDADVQLLAADSKRDIAFLKKEIDTLAIKQQYRQLSYPVGNSSELDWGNFVYIIGFPGGHKMLTSGIVSPLQQTKKEFFLTDAVFNKGISGAPVFALRDGASHLEWVGMASSGMVDDLDYLMPALEKDETFTLAEPYTGNMFINKMKLIKYGITYSVSMKEILKFVNQHKAILENNGYNMVDFLKSSPK